MKQDIRTKSWRLSKKDLETLRSFEVSGLRRDAFNHLVEELETEPWVERVRCEKDHKEYVVSHTEPFEWDFDGRHYVTDGTTYVRVTWRDDVGQFVVTANNYEIKYIIPPRVSSTIQGTIDRIKGVVDNGHAKFVRERDSQRDAERQHHEWTKQTFVGGVEASLNNVTLKCTDYGDDEADFEYAVSKEDGEVISFTVERKTARVKNMHFGDMSVPLETFKQFLEGVALDPNNLMAKLLDD